MNIENNDIEIYDNNFSIHTIELKKRVNRGDVLEYRNLLYEIVEENDNLGIYSNNGMIYIRGDNVLKDNGILLCKFIRIWCEETGYNEYQLVFVVNPMRLMGVRENESICIIDSKELGNIKNKLMELLYDIGFSREMLEGLIYSRIDYCSNINIGDEEDVYEYIKLLKRGKLNSYFDIKDNEEYEKDTEFKIACKSYELTFYSKYDQLISNDKLRNRIALNQLELSKGQIRIELRAKRNKLRTIKSNLQYDEEDLIEMASNIGERYIIDACKMLYGTGDFYKLDKIKKIISQSSNIHYNIKNTMIEISKKCARHTLHDIARYYEEIGQLNTFKHCMQVFNKLEISPICIPARYHSDFYHNPIWYISNANVNKR